MNQQSLLVVEDNKTLRRLLEYRLGKDFQVRSAAHGEEALELIDEALPDLVISDIMMPRMDGYSLFSRVREDPRSMAIPFIFLTAKSDDISRLKGLGQGVDDYITKPFDIDFLLTRINTILERTRIYQTKLNARIGRDFSDRLMPKSMPRVPGYRALFYSQPKEDGGGDLFDWVEVRPGVYILTIADIMGKGLQAKFYAFSFLSYIRSAVHAMADENDSPAALLNKVNRVLAKDEVLEETFASMLVLRWEPAHGTVTYANAGHCRPVLVTPTRAGIIEHSDMILGLNPEEAYTDRTFKLPAGSALVSYTDGLIEQVDHTGNPFGESGIAAIAHEALKSQQPIHELLRLVLKNSESPRFADDILVFWLERTNVEENPAPDSPTRSRVAEPAA